MAEYKILTINPGSTSTKIAYFKGEEAVFTENVAHDSSELAQFDRLSQQLDYRKTLIEKCLADSSLTLNDLDAVVGRGGGLMPLAGGVYEVNDQLYRDAKNGANGVEHPANLGPQLARYFARKASCSTFVVNPPDTDEYQDLARMTGVKGVYRTCHLHALNLKETALHHARKQKEIYQKVNYIVCHIGGGISISAHRRGQMIDGTDIVGGEGPMAPTRAGSLPLTGVVELLNDGVSASDLRKLCTKNGGFVSLLGSADAKAIFAAAQKGAEAEQLAWDSMIYQIAKTIGQMAAVLKGDIQAILLSGGLVNNADLVSQITDYCHWIAPVYAYPGEFEMQAMANGASRVLSGQEEVKTYTGRPVWTKEAFPF
ncbi:butyrate kinase [Streptococcus pantholopis]|uniref:Probable butyrate kinase n=1 Tax=Streptococcus pantholopis TaxID=1811193 RepID=A0A172Q8C1_9STRE|nr:butyrate kinase [Streptococcus pantholopis]AND79688.1 butyrate kinase [Streptococcus pantholopis]